MPKKIDSWNDVESPSQEIRERVNAKILECREILSRDGINGPLRTWKLPVPIVRYDLRGKTMAGYAEGTVIKLNKDMLNDPRYVDDMINDTVPHEYAHIVVAANWITAKSHGREWVWIMRLLGLPATRCHNYKVQAARTVKREFRYYCLCEEPHMITAILVKRMSQGRTYTCVKCGAILSPEPI